MAAAPPQSGEIVPPTSEMLAQAGQRSRSIPISRRLPPAPEAPMPADPPKEPAAAAVEARQRWLPWPQVPANIAGRRAPAENAARCARAGTSAGNQVRRRPDQRERQAGQRRPAPDIFISDSHARGIVPSRRYGVAVVRFQKADRCRADPRPGWVGHCRCQRHAAGKGAGDPLSSQPPATALAHGRGRGGRHELDGHTCGCHADAVAGA